MPWVVRDVVHDINKAVGRRWQGVDSLLPDPGDLPEGCMAPLVASGTNGRPAALAVCHHQHVPAGTLNQTWGTAGRFSLIPRLREADTAAALDDLLGQWRAHLAGLPEASAGDTAAMITWPSRDVSGVNTLLRHGMQALTVIAVRSAGPAPAGPAPAGPPAAADGDLVIREAGPADLDTATEFEMGVIRYDALFGAAILRPATGSGPPWSGTCTRSSTAAVCRPRCCTTRRRTRCPRRSGTGWDTGRCGPGGRCARRLRSADAEC